jgi:transposase
LLKHCGHEVLVANARKLRLIYGQGCKNGRLDAEKLAHLARLDPCLLTPIEHRGEASQAHLAIVRSREALIEARAKLITMSGVRSSHSELVCPSAPRLPSTRRSPPAYRGPWGRPWSPFWRPSPR